MYRKAENNGTSGQANPLPYTAIEETTTAGTGDIDKSSNRFRTSTTYDEAGDVVTDSKFRTMGFGYDANGRMVKATKTDVPDALSVYDAAGMRVAERVNDIWRFLVYDVDGKIVAEYGGPQSTDEGGVKYLLSDWQGSTRAVLNNNGVVNARADFTAFGEEIAAGTGQRTTVQGYGAANTPRQKYGLSERDDATGLDHTWFRKHENRAGRWTTPDAYGRSAVIGSPQKFNRYTYVSNRPTSFVDPSGLDEEPIRVYTWTWKWWDDNVGPENAGNFDWLYDPPQAHTELIFGDPRLEFDGCHLSYFDGNGDERLSWKAYSGKPGTDRSNQYDKSKGPIPEGTYEVDPSTTSYRSDVTYIPNPLSPGGGVFVSSHPLWANSDAQGEAWGNSRTPIKPIDANLGGRNGNFFIHGGSTPGSAGCIDLVDMNDDFQKWFKQNGRTLRLTVKLTCNPWK